MFGREIIIFMSIFTTVNVIWLINGLEVIPEQTGLIYANPKYISDITLSVRRYKRRSPYVLNIKARIHQTWANNVTVSFVFYEFLHNKYKRSFIEMHYKLCDIINKDPFFSPVVKMVGLPCPVPEGIVNLPNLTIINVPSVDQMPYKWPLEKAKVVAIFKTVPEKEKMVEAFLIASFKQLAVKKKSSLS